MGGMVLFHLNSLLFALRHLLHPSSSTLLLPLHLHQLPPHPSLQTHFPHLLLLLQLPLLALNARDVPEKSGMQSNGQFHNATDNSGILLQQFLLLMRKMMTLMTHWTSSMHTLPPPLSPHLTDSPSIALTRPCGTQLVRKRWRHTVLMAPGRSSSYLLGSVLLALGGL